MIENISNDLSIDCEFSRESVYYYTEDDDDVTELKQEYEHSRTAGINCELIDYAPLPFKTIGALKIPNNVSLGLTDCGRVYKIT